MVIAGETTPSRGAVRAAGRFTQIQKDFPSAIFQGAYRCGFMA